MKVLATTDPLEQLEADALVVLGFEGNAPQQVPDARVQELFDSGEFRGKTGESAVLHGPAKLKAKRLVVAGAGERKKGCEEYWRSIELAIEGHPSRENILQKIQFIPDPEIEIYYKAADVAVFEPNAVYDLMGEETGDRS